MRIAFPVQSIDNFELASDFNQCEFMTMYDTETEEYETWSKDDLSKSYSGMNVIQLFQEKQINQVISPNFRLMALKVLADHEIQVWKAFGTSISDNLLRCMNNELPRYEAYELMKDGCSTECSTCETSDVCKPEAV